jgi:hypothetical protein
VSEERVEGDGEVWMEFWRKDRGWGAGIDTHGAGRYVLGKLRLEQPGEVCKHCPASTCAARERGPRLLIDMKQFSGKSGAGYDELAYMHVQQTRGPALAVSGWFIEISSAGCNQADHTHLERSEKREVKRGWEGGEVRTLMKMVPLLMVSPGACKGTLEVWNGGDSGGWLMVGDRQLI